MADVKKICYIEPNLYKTYKPEKIWLIYRVEDVLLVLLQNVFREKEI